MSMINKIRQFHEEKQSDFTLALCQSDDISQSGIAELSNDKITRFVEKPINQVNNKTFNNNKFFTSIDDIPV